MRIRLEKKSYWDVNQVVDMDELFPGRSRMIQAMKDLTPIVETAVPPILIENLKPSKDISVFFPRFLSIFEGLRTPVRGYEIKYDGKYFVNINCFYDYNSTRFYAIPLSFLPELKKKNKALYAIMVECVRILGNKRVPIIDHPFYDDDDMLLENMGEYCEVDLKEKKPDEDKILARRELKLFKKHKKSYLKILNQPGDRLYLVGMISKYKPILKIEEMILEWARMVLDAANEPGDLDDINEAAKVSYARFHEIDVENIYDDGQPVEILQAMRFTWFGSAGYTTIECEQLGEYSGQFGEIEFSKEYSCHSADDIETARNKFLQDWGLFPEKFAAIAEFANPMIEEIWNYIDNKLTTILDTK